MKKENRVRDTVVKSIRLTPIERERIEGLARASHMSFNTYVVKSSTEPFHTEFCPQFYCYLRDISNILRTPYARLEKTDIERYEMEADYICRTLLNL